MHPDADASPDLVVVVVVSSRSSEVTVAERALTPSDSGYWEASYQAGDTGWDIGAPTPAWPELCRLHELPVGRTLVLGAGRGHDALWFAERGDQVTAVDFAPSAVAAVHSAAHARGLSLEARQADLFDLAPESFGSFDLVVEHTCFCAIERHRRPEYAAVVSRMVRPGGHFVGVFYWLTPEGGPPFSSTAADQHALFSPTFEILRLEPNPFSHARRAGKEGWGVFRRLGR